MVRFFIIEEFILKPNMLLLWLENHCLSIDLAGGLALYLEFNPRVTDRKLSL